jgi:hypothetical protein
MRWERPLLRAGEYLIGRSCRRLPSQIRDERYREWTAELPAILHDPGTRFAVRRAARMLGYAADTIRGTMLASGQAPRRRPAARTAMGIGRHIIPELAAAAFIAWATVTARGDRVRYLLTVLLIYGAGRLALLAVRRLRGRRAGRT